jgi:hypothetical protein
MPDDCHSQPDDEPLATPEQWAAMRFGSMLIDASKFGAEWQQERGAIARKVVSLLRFDDRQLTQHFLDQAEPLLHAMQMHADLQRELEYLQTHSEALELASARLLCVASRYAEQSPR